MVLSSEGPHAAAMDGATFFVAGALGKQMGEASPLGLSSDSTYVVNRPAKNAP